MGWFCLHDEELERLRDTIDRLEDQLRAAEREATQWRARYEELSRWLERPAPHAERLAPERMPAITEESDPFGEDMHERHRIQALFLEDPALAFEEAAGDGLSVTTVDTTH